MGVAAQRRKACVVKALEQLRRVEDLEVGEGEDDRLVLGPRRTGLFVRDGLVLPGVDVIDDGDGLPTEDAAPIVEDVNRSVDGRPLVAEVEAVIADRGTDRGRVLLGRR